jgi:hypothetical protein
MAASMAYLAYALRRSWVEYKRGFVSVKFELRQLDVRLTVTILMSKQEGDSEWKLTSHQQFGMPGTY